MKTMLTKTLAVILTTVLLLSVIPFTASAAEATEDSVGATSGTTGDCTWTLEDGVLTISGNGAMENYSQNFNAPWNKNEVKQVVIQKGVTNIGDEAFCSCGNLTSVIISDSVTRIGTSSFSYCDSLTDVTIPDSVISIDLGAFYGCSSITSIYIPKSVLSLTSKFACAFECCTNLSNIVVDSDNPNFCSIDGNLYDKNGTTLIQYAIGKTATSFTIPDFVTNVSWFAFEGCSNLTSVIIPNSVTYIAWYTFYDCINLTSVTIPDTVTEIGDGAFLNCKKLNKILIPNSVTSLGGWAFEGCTSLTSVMIPDSVTSIEDHAFGYDYNNGYQKIDGFEISGYRGTAAETYASDNGFTFIPLDDYTYRKLDDGTAEITGYTGTETEIVIPSILDGYTVTSIGNSSFGRHSNLISVTIPDSVTNIGENAFRFCSRLASVTIPDSVTSIGDYAFERCYNLTNIIIPNSVTRIGYMAFGYDNSGQFNSDKIDGFTITGYKGSAAETYANDNGLTFIAIDKEKPTVFLSSTNNVASCQTVTIKLNDDEGIRGYYWGTSANYSHNSFTETSETSITKTVDLADTYYVTAIDTAGKASSTESITFYKTTLDANSGSVSPAVVLTMSGNSFAFPTPTRDNYSYVGWADSSSASTGIENLTPPSNATYYAVWKTNYQFIWGQDNWSFNNKPDYFGYKYYINDTVWEKYVKQFKLNEKEKNDLMQWMNNKNSKNGFSGSCYGMTLTEILVKQGFLHLTDYQDEENPVDPKKKIYPIVNDNEANENIISLINAVQFSQKTDSFKQTIRQSAFLQSSFTQSDFIQKLEQFFNEEKMFVKIGYKLWDYDNNYHLKQFEHAVLAYGIEQCDRSITNNYTNETMTYDRKILICDPNKTKENMINDNYCIYYSSKNYSWIIPNRCNQYGSKCYWNAGSPQFSDTGLLVNAYKYDTINTCSDLISEYSIDHYLAGLEISANQEYDIQMIDDTTYPDMEYAGENNSGIARYFAESDDTDNGSDSFDYYALWNPNSDYRVTFSNPSTANIHMDYENIAYQLNVSKANSVLYKPSGLVQLKGSKSDYSIKMVTNDCECVTDWYALTVAGKNADTVTLKKSRGGYLLSGSNLKDVTLKAYNSEAEASGIFSTDYDKVFIYEINENTIGVKADTDGDGRYETELPLKSLTIGDANSDGVVNVRDITAIQRYLAYLEDLTDTELELADTNGDGIVSIKDATHLQKYLAEYDVVLGKTSS